MPSCTTCVADIVTALTEGIPDLTEAERLEDLAGYAQVIRLVPELVADKLEEYVRRERLRLGLCPHCGLETEAREVREARPYGDTVAYEAYRVRVCEKCGEVES